MRKSILALSCVLAFARVAAGTPVALYSNLQVTNGMAAASRPISSGVAEIEAGDDFILNGGGALITEFKFIGLATRGLNDLAVAGTNLEIYRVFPKDSGPFDNRVPTRANSPSDVAFTEKDFADLASLTATVIAQSFTAGNSVLNGINPSPFQTTQGEGPVTGTEIMFDAVLKTPFFLPADHYFFVPQIESLLGQFYWLSASRPIAAPGTPINPDLQAWIRNGNIDPDWLRIGTDIVGGATPPTFNMAFEVDGDVVPEPATLLLFGTGIAALARRARKTR